MDSRRLCLDAALAYAARGWAVLPVRASSKVPLTEHGVKDASLDAAAIRGWWERWPDANVAIACGEASGGLIVLDCDDAEFVWALEKSCGPLPETLTVATGRGSHRYFTSSGPVRTQTLAPHLEIRAEGAYIVAPPSTHSNGNRYRVITDIDPAPLPAGVIEIPRTHMRSAVVPSAAEVALRQGQRNSTLTSLAGSMRRRGMAPESITAALLAENEQRCDPPLSESEVHKIAASVSRYEPAENGRPMGKSATTTATKVVRKSAATLLMELARKHSDLFHFGDDCFATFGVGDHRETYALRSRGFRSWLTKIFFEHEERAASSEAVSTTIATLEGFARFQSEERPVFVRIAEHTGTIYIDLCDLSWRVVEVTAAGWQLIDAKDCPVRFRRAHGMLPMPEPQRGGNISQLRNFLNVGSDEDFVLLTGWLIAALHPRGPYPILILHGEQGSAKSTTARVLRNLIDPNAAPLRSEPREPRDLMIAANNGWLAALDNLSRIPDWLSDGLCRLATGGGFGTRALYTDDDEKIFESKRPVIINGIEELASRGDLLDRALVVDLPRIADEQRRDEKSINTAFELVRPQIFGAILDGVVAALSNIDSVRVQKLPRLADAALWITAAEPALGWQSGRFLTAHEANRNAVNELPLEIPVGEALRKLELPETGTSTELLAKLETVVDERTRKSKAWPTSGRSLSNVIRRLAPNLRQAGIAVEFSREPGTGKRVISLSEDAGTSSSQPSQVLPRDKRDGRDDGKHQFPFPHADNNSETLPEGDDEVRL
jgi:hypothetical protein